MKTYILSIEIIDGDTVEDMTDFIYGEFSKANVEVVSVDGNRARIELETDDNFDYGYFEDCMDNAGYDTEFLELYK